MFVSKKTLVLIHVIPCERTSRIGVGKPIHDLMKTWFIGSRRGIARQPLSEFFIKGGLLRHRFKPGLLDEGFFGAEGDVFHNAQISCTRVSCNVRGGSEKEK